MKETKYNNITSPKITKPKPMMGKESKILYLPVFTINAFVALE
jgi:hypothetical protein